MVGLLIDQLLKYWGPHYILSLIAGWSGRLGGPDSALGPPVDDHWSTVIYSLLMIDRRDDL